MKSINQEIAMLLNKHLSILKCMKRGIINNRSLAKFLREEYSLKYSLDAVISAIRRFDLDDTSLMGNGELDQYFSKMIISTKDNVARLVLKDKAFKEICNDFLGKKILKENCRILKSKERVTIVINQKDFEDKIGLFKPQDIVRTQTDLSEIRLQFPKDISKKRGIVARITSELSMRNVNIEEFFYSIPDLLLYVKEENLVDAHQALRELKS